MRAFIVSVVSLLTFNRVRGRAVPNPSLRWWWTPWTSYFGAGGWVFLSPRRLVTRWRDERDRRRFVAAQRGAQ